MKKFMLITLGEELLLGLTRNGHLTYIGNRLRQRGVTLHSCYTISDKDEDILEQFQFCWERADALITTGGLGPTVDDRTKETIANFLGEGLVFDPVAMEAIEERFARLGRAVSENNRKQAYRPETAETIRNDRGTAPGIWWENNGKTLIMLPGPPNELQPMFENQVLPRLEAMGFVDDAEDYLQIKTIGIGESQLEIDLQPIFEPYPDLEVAFCAHQGQVDCRIRFIDSEPRMDELLAIANSCKQLLGEAFLGLGHDPVVAVVSKMLTARSQSLALAESCTGGFMANAFTNLSGASEFFKGGIVSYSNEAKRDLLGVPSELIQRHTAVSEEVAIAMASGVAEKLESDFALSVTGYAGPCGGTTDNPVGTVYIGLHSPLGSWATRYNWTTNRETIKSRALNAALDLLRRELLATPFNEKSANQDPSDESGGILPSIS